MFRGSSLQDINLSSNKFTTILPLLWAIQSGHIPIADLNISNNRLGNKSLNQISDVLAHEPIISEEEWAKTKHKKVVKKLGSRYDCWLRSLTARWIGANVDSLIIFLFSAANNLTLQYVNLSFNDFRGYKGDSIKFYTLNNNKVKNLNMSHC